MKLFKVIYIGRHGERAPIKIPASLKKDWGMAGMLTSKGAESQYKKGQSLRTKYHEFFESIKGHIFCQSSNMDRTIDSGFCLLNGFIGTPFSFPGNISKKDKVRFLTKYGANIKPLDVDVIYKAYYGDVSPAVIPMYSNAAEDAFAKKDHFEELIPIVPLAKKFYNVNDKLPIDHYALFYLADLLECYKTNEIPFPIHFEDGKVHKTLSFMHFYMVYDLMFKITVVHRIANHYFYKQVFDIMTDSSGPSFHYYSAHDTNVLAFILGLGYNINEVPPYNTGLIIEVYESEKQKFASFEYNGQNLNKKLFPDIKTEYIPFDDVEKKFEKECFESDEEFRQYSGNKEFDYERDYINAKQIDTDESDLSGPTQLDLLSKSVCK